MTATKRLTPTARRPSVTYWALTAIVITECLAGGVLDLARQPPFYPAMIHLGYPPYFADILGSAKLLAALALLAPGLPRLKQWAYAGIMVNMIAAVLSHLAVRRTAGCRTGSGRASAAPCAAPRPRTPPPAMRSARSCRASGRCPNRSSGPR
jgi:uncharacterized membrane protein YphA (DoxX/SURF4 family)